MSSYKSFFNSTNVLVVVALLALILFRHSLFPEATESSEVKQLMGKMDEVIDDMQNGAESTATEQSPSTEESTVAEEVPVVPEQVVTARDSNDVKDVPVEPVVTAPEIVADDMGKNGNQEALTIWQTARRAAWDGNNDAAIQNYRALIKLQPGNYDAYGEMGNVMMQQGDNQGAVEAYSQAAILLGKSGYPQAAWHVMNIVAQLDQERAQQLHKTLYGQPLPAAK